MTLVIATEDELSECVALKLIGPEMLDTLAVQRIRKGGNGYLRSRMMNFVAVAQRLPVLMLTDLDRTDCPPALIREWRRGRELPENFLLRIAVREIESWLLADREGIAGYLKIEPRKITIDPEEIPDPKRYLLNLARHAPRHLRHELLPAAGSIASQGFGYNSCLGKFVAEVWSPPRAAESSESLRRAINRISELPMMVQGANA